MTSPLWKPLTTSCCTSTNWTWVSVTSSAFKGIFFVFFKIIIFCHGQDTIKGYLKLLQGCTTKENMNQIPPSHNLIFLKQGDGGGSFDSAWEVMKRLSLLPVGRFCQDFVQLAGFLQTHHFLAQYLTGNLVSLPSPYSSRFDTIYTWVDPQRFSSPLPHSLFSANYELEKTQ